MASFPSSIKTFSTLVDLSDSVLAAHQNERGDEITAVETWLLQKAIPQGVMVNGKLSVTVSSNDLIVAIKTLAGSDPSASAPVLININGSIRTISSARSLTLADGTNWFNAGGAELATKAVPYFVYAVWDSNSSAVAVGLARIPYGRLVSDFSGTTTNEKYLGGYSGFTSTDDVANIGYCEATLSAGAGYTWTVASFTNANLRHEPTFESRVSSWTPTHTRVTTPYTNTPTTNRAEYQVRGRLVWIYEMHTQHGTPGGTGVQRFTLPFTSGYSATSENQPVFAVNNNTGLSFNGFIVTAQNYLNLSKYDGTAEATASQVYITEGSYLI